MATTSLSAALGTLRDAVHSHGATFDGGLLRELGQHSTQLLLTVIQQMEQAQDPRLSLEMAAMTESVYRDVLRAQLSAAAALEATGAHRLAIEEYDAIRRGDVDYANSPDYLSGRAHYQDTSRLLEAWLDIEYWEAKNRVDDAHRVVSRRTMAGNGAPPRFERLAALFSDRNLDPRLARDAARRLEKFEPPDQIHDGQELKPSAVAPDGVLLEEHAARVLRENQRASAKKHFKELCTEYAKEHTEVSKPELGIFKLPTVQGVERYQVNVAGLQAEIWRSVCVQADNPRTIAGQAARMPQGAAEMAPTPAREAATDHDAAPGTVGTASSPARVGGDQPEDPQEAEVGEWMKTTQPPPDWATDKKGPEAAVAEPSDRAATENNWLNEGVNTDGVCPARRRLNALMALMTRRADSRGASATIVPSVVVTMTLNQLMHLSTAYGVTTHGIKIEAGELRQLLVRAKVLPHVLGGQSQILDAGRSRRFHSDAMRTALYVRDRGCIMPDCSYPPELCEVNHWPDGGWAGGCGTSVREGALFCPREHGDFHAGKFKIILHNGLPHVLLPPHLDPTQTPQRNKYWFPNTYLHPTDQLDLPERLGEPPGAA